MDKAFRARGYHVETTGNITNEAVKRLMPQNLTDQYAFLTTRAIEILKFEGSEML